MKLRAQQKKLNKTHNEQNASSVECNVLHLIFMTNDNIWEISTKNNKKKARLRHSRKSNGINNNQ